MLIGALLCCAFAGPTHAALWYESYEQAEQAIEDENWQEAVRLLTEALESKGDPNARARTYGMNFIAYFPYLKLGVAYYGMGEFEAATQALDTEEQLGAIADSRPALAELQRYRGLIDQARQTAAAAERQRIQQIVDQSLRDARALERQGKLDEALQAVGRALAVDESNPDATAMIQELRTKSAQVEQRRLLEARVADLIGRGKTMLANDQLDEASTLFSQALAADPRNAEAQALANETRTKLRARMTQQTEERRAATIATGLREARDLEQAGKPMEALNRLQGVLALAPDNAEAAALRQRLLVAQARIEEDAAKSSAVGGLLERARQAIEAQDYDLVVSVSNQVLSLEPGNSDARRFISQAYGQISQQLLGARTQTNLPPAITYNDLRQVLTKVVDGVEESFKAQVLRSPRLLLYGTVMDSSAVTLELYGPGNELLSNEIDTPAMELGGFTGTQFRIRYSLDQGESVFRVVATDPAGLTTTSEYMVRYIRPLWRNPWIYAAVLVLVLGLVGAQVAHRTRVRMRRLKRRFNPYIAGAPVMQQELFYGRERLINHVLDRIHNNSILLYGERRIGKTSIQHRLRSRLRELRDPKYKFFAAFVDLQGTPEDRFFATMADDLFHELAPLLDGLKPSVSTSDGNSYDHRAFQRDIRSVIKVLKEKTDKQVKLVLLIDEVDELNNYDPRVNQRLRSLFMKSFAENLVAVVSGVGIKKQWELEGSPWYNFFQEIEVQPFQRKDAVELIEGPIRGVFKLEDGVIDNILEVTGCKPYLIQRVCAAAVNRVHDQKRRRITIDDVKAVAQVAEVL